MESGDDQWWKGATLYQIYPLSFADSNGDGWGDLPGITERLEYVASLGVDGIWLSPFYCSAWADFGYDTTDHKQVDPRCGSMADFDRLLDRAHSLGLKVLIDQVYTYTSNRHPWFQASRSQPHGKHGDWYVWADAEADGAAPNNWVSIFGGPAWSWDMARRQYYMTHFLQEMPHLRTEHPDVQDELLSIGRFWLERGVDGFRLDVINLATVDAQLRDNPASGESGVLLPAHAQVPLHDASRPEAFDFVTRIRALADERSGRFLLGEIAGRRPMEVARSYTADRRGLHSAYFVLGADQSPLSATSLRADLEAWSDGEQGWPTWSFSNHDIVRGPTRCGHLPANPAFAKLLVAILISARGTALLYQGDEIGLPDAQLPYEALRDPASRRFYPDHLQRDGARTPMAWDGKHPVLGFSAGEPWLPIAETHRALCVNQQESDPESILALSRTLIAIRKQHTALRTGTMCFHDLGDALLGFSRNLDGETIVCVFNLSETQAKFEWSECESGRPLVSHGVISNGSDGIVLGAFGFILVESAHGVE
jgi:alpha-glucosidase